MILLSHFPKFWDYKYVPPFLRTCMTLIHSQMVKEPRTGVNVILVSEIHVLTVKSEKSKTGTQWEEESINANPSRPEGCEQREDT